MATPAQHYEKAEKVLAELDQLQAMIQKATDDEIFVGAETAEYLSKTVVNMIALAQVHATLATATASRDIEESHWTPNHWWRVVAPDDSLRCETSDEDEARKSMQPFDRLMRGYNTGVQWREIL